MTDKQIIETKNGYYCIEPCVEIKQLKEQLKAKEQECERLKEENFTFEQLIKEIEKYGAIEEIIQQLDQLKAENEELKKQVCGLRPELKCIIDKTCCKYNIDAKYYHEKIIEIINNLDKYKQTLTEIKDFTEHFYSKHCPICDDEECEMYIEDCILDEIVNPILQKISEVEDEF